MRSLNPCLALLAVVLVVTLVGCSKKGSNSADVSDRIRKSLDQAGFTNVSVAQLTHGASLSDFCDYATETTADTAVEALGLG